MLFTKLKLENVSYFEEKPPSKQTTKDINKIK